MWGPSNMGVCLLRGDSKDSIEETGKDATNTASGTKVKEPQKEEKQLLPVEKNFAAVYGKWENAADEAAPRRSSTFTNTRDRKSVV